MAAKNGWVKIRARAFRADQVEQVKQSRFGTEVQMKSGDVFVIPVSTFKVIQLIDQARAQSNPQERKSD